MTTKLFNYISAYGNITLYYNANGDLCLDYPGDLAIKINPIQYDERSDLPDCPEEDKDVHTEHCCANNGCEYWDDDCPVWLGLKKQSYPYSDGFEGYDPHIPNPTKTEFELRRNLLKLKQDLEDRF